MVSAIETKWVAVSLLLALALHVPQCKTMDSSCDEQIGALSAEKRRLIKVEEECRAESRRHQEIVSEKGAELMLAERNLKEAVKAFSECQTVTKSLKETSGTCEESIAEKTRQLADSQLEIKQCRQSTTEHVEKARSLTEEKCKEAAVTVSEVEAVLKATRQENVAKINRLSDDLKKCKDNYGHVVEEKKTILETLEKMQPPQDALFTYSGHFAAIGKLYAVVVGCSAFTVSRAVENTPESLATHLRLMVAYVESFLKPVWEACRPYLAPATIFVKRQYASCSLMVSDFQKTETFATVKSQTWNALELVLKFCESINEKATRLALEPLYGSQPHLRKIIPQGLFDRLVFLLYMGLAFMIVTKVFKCFSKLMSKALCCLSCSRRRSPSCASSSKNKKKKGNTSAANDMASKSQTTGTTMSPSKDFMPANSMPQQILGRKLENAAIKIKPNK